MTTMTKEQEKEAVEYNKARAFDRDQWVFFQMRIDADADGLPGKETAGKLYEFQRARGLETVDGKANDETTLELLSIEAPYHEIEAVGVWCDLPSYWLTERAGRVAEELEELGIDYLLLQLNKSGEPEFNPMWTPARIKAFSAALIARGVRVGFMLWCYPSKAWVDGLEDRLKPLVDACAGGCFAIDCDIEGPWSPSKLSGYETTFEASDALLSVVETAAGCSGARIMTTTFFDALSPSNESRRYAVEVIGDHCGAQMYASTTNGSNGDFYAAKGPCRRARLELPRFAELSSCGVIAGGSCYSMSYKGRDPVEALERHAECALFAGMREMCYWSLKHILSFWFSGNSANQRDQKIKHEYNGRWFKRLKQKRSKNACKHQPR